MPPCLGCPGPSPRLLPPLYVTGCSSTSKCFVIYETAVIYTRIDRLPVFVQDERMKVDMVKQGW